MWKTTHLCSQVEGEGTQINLNSDRTNETGHSKGGRPNEVVIYKSIELRDSSVQFSHHIILHGPAK